MLTHCPITGVRLVPFALCLLAGFVFCFAYDFLVHGILLMPAYEQTASLWRTQEDMNAHFPAMLLKQALFTAIAALIFTRHYEARGLGEGLRFGLLIGALSGVIVFGSYAYMPVPLSLGLSWLGSEIVKGLGLGVIFALLYRK